jgi:endonuclease/exonuclease/phosphatase family metal-dependent hydrolase
MSWNVRSLRDDRRAAIRVLRACAPDVLFVQEAPRFLRAQSKLAALARETGLVVAAGGRPAAGVAILTSLRVDGDGPRASLLSKTPRLHQRGLALAQLSFGDHSFTAASVHLGLDASERERHVVEIGRLLGNGPSVVGGDFNETSGGTAWRTLATGHVDPSADADLPTFSTSNPRRRIDAILVPEPWSTAAISPFEIVPESDVVKATDHRPVIVDVLG